MFTSDGAPLIEAIRWKHGVGWQHLSQIKYRLFETAYFSPVLSRFGNSAATYKLVEPYNLKDTGWNWHKHRWCFQVTWSPLLDIQRKLWLSASNLRGIQTPGATTSGWKGAGRTLTTLPAASIPTGVTAVLRHCQRTIRFRTTPQQRCQTWLTRPWTTPVPENVRALGVMRLTILYKRNQAEKVAFWIVNNNFQDTI